MTTKKTASKKQKREHTETQILENKTKRFAKDNGNIFEYFTWKKFTLRLNENQLTALEVALLIQDKTFSVVNYEKTRSAFGLQFDKSNVVIANRKFGYSLLTDDENFNLDDFTKEATQVSKFFERFFRKNANELIDGKFGFYILKNRNNSYLNTHLFFDKKAKRKIRNSKTRVSKNMNPIEQFTSELRHMANRNKKTIERYNCSIAAILTFFAWLEHCLLLLYPFSKDFKINELGHFRSKCLLPKWDVIFGRNATLNQYSEQLKDIYQNYRNLFVHSGTPKSSSEFDIGFGNRFRFKTDHKGKNFMPKNWYENFDENLEYYENHISKFFTDLIKEIESDNQRYGYKIIKTGADIPLKRDYLSKSRSSLTSNRKYLEFVDQLEFQIDRYDNAET